LAYFSENIKTAMIEYKKFVSPQAVTNIPCFLCFENLHI